VDQRLCRLGALQTEVSQQGIGSWLGCHEVTQECKEAHLAPFSKVS